ncbi:helix-turn-helix domain-containing protein [Herbaspirillum huttiense]|uniref:helix-turn-helix domain-containing protein n=1 Tax=Herbaspirillum huttiense TaxID=863372 RepID=UPI003B3B8E85
MSTTELALSQASPEELEAEVGDNIRRYRIDELQLDQRTLAERAGISVRALRNLELGNGTSLRTFLVVISAMGRYPRLLEALPQYSREVVKVFVPKQRQRVRRPQEKKDHSS